MSELVIYAEVRHVEVRHVRGRHVEVSHARGHHVEVGHACRSWSCMPKCFMSKCFTSKLVMHAEVGHACRSVSCLSASCPTGRSSVIFTARDYLFFLCWYGMLLCYNSIAFFSSCVLNLVMFIKVMVPGPTLASWIELLNKMLF